MAEGAEGKTNNDFKRQSEAMSSTEVYLEPDEIEDFIQDTLSTDALVVIGDERNTFGLCPYVTFYVYHTPDQCVSLAEKMIGIYDEFSKLTDVPFHQVWRDDVRAWLPAGDERASALDELLQIARRSLAEEQAFYLDATDQEEVYSSARWAFCARVRHGGRRYSSLKLTFRHKWYRQNKERWHAFVQGCLAQLQPEHCYSGFEVGNGGFRLLGFEDTDIMERICADHFHGMDIDHVEQMAAHSYRHHRDDALFEPLPENSLFELFSMGGDDPSGKYIEPDSLGAGLRTPTWCFLLTSFWLDKLGKSAADVRAELNDPRIEIVDIPFAAGPHNPKGQPALWIRLGELDLHPVDHGVPEVLVKASRFIRPIRCDQLKLFGPKPCGHDPNPRFDLESGVRWMRRFDEDSNWPSVDQRKPLMA